MGYMNKIQKNRKYIINVVYYTPNQLQSGFDGESSIKEEADTDTTNQRTDSLAPKK